MNRRATILVVDDEPHNRKLLETLLRPEGYLTITAADGEEALAAVAKHHPDLILLDIMMPGMDGYQVADVLKADLRTASIPIIMVTAQVDREARLAGLHAGAEEFLTKPVDRAELWLRVRNLLRLRRTQAALEEARDEADRANLAKSEFLSRMSHELRTPLHAVLGFGQILSMDELRADQRENIEFILKAGQHLLDLINDVLDIAHIETGGIRLSLEPVHLTDVLGAALDLVRPLAGEDNLTLPLVGLDADVYVVADRQRLLQVLLNLLSNAVKYNRAGGEITAMCERSGGTVTIAITDTGIGMTRDSLARLFTPFDRLGAEETEVEGTGVGMALSRVLSQHMGGSLTVHSTVGVGSTFMLELPEAALPEPAEVAVTRPLAPVAAGSGIVSVLCFEDNIANVRLIERAVGRMPDVEVITAIQGRLGLDLARQHIPDVVLLDLHLPDMPGQEVLRRLRADPATASVPVVITTADASPGQAERLIEQGATAYLTKPLDLVELFDLIERVRIGEPLT